MNHLPLYISSTFIATTLATLWFLYKASHRSKLVVVISAAWLALQAILGLQGFYEHSFTTPPRILLLAIPPVASIMVLFITPKGRAWLSSLNAEWLTYLHVIRVPVELVLWWLFLRKLVPQTITFEGNNFDVLSGITAPLIAYWGYTKPRLPKPVLITWNFICLALLANVVAHAVLSAPTVLQKIDFSQPNKAILLFPFVWLPSFVVPVVLLAHLTSLRRLLQK